MNFHTSVPALLLAAGLLGSAGCVTTADAPATAADAPAPTTTAASGADAGPDAVICEYVATTASRVRRERLCRTQREIDDDEREARSLLGAADRGNAAQGGGESISGR